MQRFLHVTTNMSMMQYNIPLLAFPLISMGHTIRNPLKKNIYIYIIKRNNCNLYDALLFMLTKDAFIWSKILFKNVKILLQFKFVFYLFILF